MIEPMSREIAQLEFEGKLKTAVEEPGQSTEEVDFGGWQASVAYGFPQPDGRHAPGTKDAHGSALIAQLGPDAYAFAGGSVVHFSNGAADVEQVADDTSNFDGVASVFLTPEGALRFEGSGYLMERDSSGNWNTLTPSTSEVRLVSSLAVVVRWM